MIDSLFLPIDNWKINFSHDMDFKENLLELQSSASNYPFYEYPPKLSREKGTFAVSNNRSKFAMWKKPEKVEENARKAFGFFYDHFYRKKITGFSVWAAIDGRGRAWYTIFSSGRRIPER